MNTGLKQHICVALLCTILPVAAAAQQLAEKKGLTLELAKKVGAAAEIEAARNKWAMAIAVVDEGGHLIYLTRMDEAPFGTIEVATQKAYTAAAWKQPTKAFEDAVNGGRTSFLKAPGLLPIEGGVPIMIDGKVIGAIGVSGGAGPQDAGVALAGVEALRKILERKDD